MKLVVDFSQLISNVFNMGVKEIVNIDLKKGKSYTPEFDINIETSTGIEIDISDIEIVNGIFSYKGKQVSLFIPDHSFKFELAIEDIDKRNKYHLTDCKTLEDMRNKGRFARYHITTNDDEIFEIYGKTDSRLKVKLQVCKNCLDKLNYRNYRGDRTKIFK